MLLDLEEEKSIYLKLFNNLMNKDLVSPVYQQKWSIMYF